jgi:hypothetical protein
VEIPRTEFDQVYQLLFKQFEEWELPIRLLRRLPEPTSRLNLAEAAAITRTAAEAYPGNLNDVPNSIFEKIVHRAVAEIREAARALFVKGKNSSALTLTQSDPIRWTQEPAYMKEVIRNGPPTRVKA